MDSTQAPPKDKPAAASIMAGSLAQKLGIEILEADPQLTVATMPVAGNTQPAGILHGGASAVLAETLGSCAANLLVAGSRRAAVGLDLNITHVRPARAGLVTGTCRAVHLGRSICVHSIEITDETGKLIATARITNKIIDVPAS